MPTKLCLLVCSEGPDLVQRRGASRGFRTFNLQPREGGFEETVLVRRASFDRCSDGHIVGGPVGVADMPSLGRHKCTLKVFNGTQGTSGLTRDVHRRNTALQKLETPDVRQVETDHSSLVLSVLFVDIDDAA